MSFNAKKEAEDLFNEFYNEWIQIAVGESVARRLARRNADIAIQHFLGAGLNVGTRKNWLEVRKEVKKL